MEQPRAQTISIHLVSTRRHAPAKLVLHGCFLPIYVLSGDSECASLTSAMAGSDTDAAELELSSEDDHFHPNVVTSSSPLKSPPSLAVANDGDDDDDDNRSEDVGPSSDAAALRVRAGLDAEEDEDAEVSESTKAPRASLDDGVSYASYLWDNPRVVLEQADESRGAIKRMVTFFKDKVRSTTRPSHRSSSRRSTALFCTLTFRPVLLSARRPSSIATTRRRCASSWKMPRPMRNRTPTPRLRESLTTSRRPPSLRVLLPPLPPPPPPPHPPPPSSSC